MIASQIHNKLVKLKRLSESTCKTVLRETFHDVVEKEATVIQNVDWNRKITEVNNFIWSPPDGLSGEDLVREVHRQVIENIQSRSRETWPRSPLNVAVHKMQTRIVEMLVKQAEFNINSVDDIKDCQRTPLTVAISRAKTDLGKSMEMIRILVGLGANVNKKLLWKRKSAKTCLCDVQTFSGLHWAISLDVPEIVQLLIDLGADTTQRGCLLDDNRTWVCGTPLRLAQEINASKEIITILECYGREKRSESSGRCNTTTIHIGKPNWAGFLEQAKGYNEDADEKLYSALSLLRTIDALTSDPDYLTEQQIEAEQRKIIESSRRLDFQITRTSEINEEIRKIRAETPFLSENEVRNTLERKTLIHVDGPSLG